MGMYSPITQGVAVQLDAHQLTLGGDALDHGRGVLQRQPHDQPAMLRNPEPGGLLALGVLDAGELAGDWPHASSRDLDTGERAGGRPAGGQLTSDLLGGAVSPDDLAVLIPTSGTTGRSKLVMQTHRAYVLAGEGFPYWMELTAQDRLMTSLPLFHINAPAYSVMGSLACGAGLILLPRFSASGFLDAARRHGATEFNAIGANAGDPDAPAAAAR
jgi:acyl-CoA synthetase (AMP-forming)/AMP-acid ligase II